MTPASRPVNVLTLRPKFDAHELEAAGVEQGEKRPKHAGYTRRDLEGFVSRMSIWPWFLLAVTIASMMVWRIW